MGKVTYYTWFPTKLLLFTITNLIQLFQEYMICFYGKGDILTKKVIISITIEKIYSLPPYN